MINSEIIIKTGVQIKTKASMAIFCRSLKENDDPFSSDYYWQAYQDLMLELKERGIESYLVTDNSTYLGNGKFSKAYTIDEKRRLTDLIELQDISVDLVINRADFSGEDVLTINNPIVQRIGTNKIEMFKNFGQFQPKTVICNNNNEVLIAYNEISGDKIVVKEPESYGGHHVYIGSREEVNKMLTGNYPVIVQEFLDTSMGVPGYAEGVHDMRLSMCGGELIGCYIRQAKPGNLHSNVAQGGKMIFIDVSDAPSEVVKAAKEIDKTFAKYPRYYSIDFVNTNKGWKMLEINALLAFLPVTDGAEAKKTLTNLANYIAKNAVDQISKL